MFKAVILTAVLILSFTSSNANAHCRWVAGQWECAPGWERRDGRDWQREHEMRREYGPRGDEWRREEYRRDEERQHREWLCARHPWKC